VAAQRNPASVELPEVQLVAGCSFSLQSLAITPGNLSPQCGVSTLWRMEGAKIQFARMTITQELPQVGDLVRHHPTGFPVRIENIRGTHRNMFGILFSDGMKDIAHLVELDFDLTDEEKKRFITEMPA
jgi:hypothetical protein